MEKDNGYWPYFKSFVLYSLSLNKNEYVNCIKDDCFTPEGVSKGIAEIREKLGQYKGLILKRNGLDDFSIEEGEWTKDEYIGAWSYFIIFFTMDGEKSVERLYNAIINYSDRIGVSKLSILNSLWKESWIVHRMNYAILYYRLSNNTDFDKLTNIYDEVRVGLEKAKAESRTLDEWTDRQFELVALVSAGQLIADDIKTEESEKFARYLEEMKADLMEFFFVAMEGVLTNNPFVIIEQYAPISAEPEKYRKELRFRHKSRVHMPKYWYELALTFTEVSDLSSETFWMMTQFDAISVLGKFFQISSPHMMDCFEFISTGNVKAMENEKIMI